MSDRNRRRETSHIPSNERVIGEHIVLQESHTSSLRETEDFEKKQKTIENYCNRITNIIKWIEEHYPGYYEIGVVELTDRQKQENRRYHTQTHDLRYYCLNVNMIKAFISAHKYKGSAQIQYRFVHMCKNNNAIQYGAK